jgi:ABC-type polysaccharide/polyol phosphate transport system ATPase subunit
MSTDPAIRVDGVSKRFRLYHERNESLKVSVLRGRRARYEEFWALRDVSFDVAVGTTFGLIGENGSGKSTLLKCIARILRPDEGTIASQGKISALLELGAGFHPELSGRENIYLNAAILGLTKKKVNSKLDDIVEFAGLEQFIDTPVKHYSSGMYMRLGFSIAINVEPDILLVDEILAVGDESFQRKCTEKFSDLREAGKTIIIVTHALGTVRTLCDDVALLEHGRVRAMGPASDIVEEYLVDVHHDQVADGVDGYRYGTREATVERAEILDGHGRPIDTVATGEPATIRIHYSSPEPIERPVFGLAVFSNEGVHVTGPNSRLDDAIPDKIEGDGHIDYQIERLLLVPNTYFLSIALVDYSCTHTFDHRHRLLRFDVRPGVPREDSGVVSLGGSWSDPVPEGDR